VASVEAVADLVVGASAAVAAEVGKDINVNLYSSRFFILLKKKMTFVILTIRF
jgi:hypothetical protein